MKKLILASMVFFATAVTVFAQKEKESGKGDGGFKKENLFTGGSITLSFFNNQTVIGADPYFGYKLADWVDAGVAFNFLYSGQRNYYEYNDRVRQTVYGPGIFTRLYPVNFLFAQAQFEHNFTTLKYIPAPGGSYLPDKLKTGANSLLLGAGWAQGRQEGSNSFYYISILFDVLKDINSPYVNVEYNPANPSQQRKVMTPVIRAGVNIGLFQGRYR